jgi:carbonic anhydrase
MAERHKSPQPTPLYDEVMGANAAYVECFGDKGGLALPPARGFAILTCMDARLDPAKFAGLAEGDAHVIRNAGGRASDDAIRSLVISHKLLGTNQWFVVHHTDCGMLLFDGATMAGLLRESLATASFDGKRWSNVEKEGGSAEGGQIAWLTFADLAQSVRDDVERIRSHPLTPKNLSGASSMIANRASSFPSNSMGHRHSGFDRG